MNFRNLSPFIVLILSALTLTAFAQDTSYQKGSITTVSSSGDKRYDVRDGAHGYQINNCGDFQVGQTVEYMVKGDKLSLRVDGKEYKCAIKARYTPTVAPVSSSRSYLKGTIQGYEVRYRVSRGSTGAVRRAKVYDLLGPDLIYEIDFCGAFQAGEFTTGQALEFRVDGERVYVRHDNDKEYSCQLEGTIKPGEAKPAEDQPAASAPSTAKLSITSIPDGADIEIDGNFSGNTPSNLEVPEGEHAITVKKSGYKAWERKLKVVAGSNVNLKPALEKATNP